MLSINNININKLFFTIWQNIIFNKEMSVLGKSAATAALIYHHRKSGNK